MTKEVVLVMGTNLAKVRRDWEFTRNWLRHHMQADPK